MVGWLLACLPAWPLARVAATSSGGIAANSLVSPLLNSMCRRMCAHSYGLARSVAATDRGCAAAMPM